MQEQQCSTCYIVKSIDNFGFAKKAENKYKKQCKKCISDYDKQYRKDKASGKIIKKQEITVNNEIQCPKCNVFKKVENFHIRSDNGKYRNECIECKTQNAKKYIPKLLEKKREKTAEKQEITDILKQYEPIILKNECIICNTVKSIDCFIIRKDNDKYRNECKDCANQIQRERHINNIQYRIKRSIRGHVYRYLNVKNGLKTKSSSKYIGISLFLLRKWIEFQFEPEMSWENYGTYWTIDHVLPLSLFDMTNKNHQNISFNWKNLRPCTDNFVKNNKIYLWCYFNTLISSHRFINKYNLNSSEYQGLNESLTWLRTKLGYGNNLF
jgi:hypothetical protein